MPKGYYPRPTLQERIEKYTNRLADGCHVWTGWCDDDGYGGIQVKYKTSRVTRVVWELSRGPIPKGFLVCHTCDNPPCINIEHLFLGTVKDNAEDAKQKGRLSSVHDGEENGNSILTDEIVRRLRDAFDSGTRQCDLMREFGLNRVTVHNVVRRKTWTHIN